MRLGSVAILLGAVLAGCVQPGSDGGTTPAPTLAAEAMTLASFADAAGDATDGGPRGTLQALCPACPPLEVLPPGTEAPYFDITAVRIGDGGDGTLFIELGLAGLDEGFPQLDAAMGEHRIASYSVCFMPAPDAGVRCAVADVATTTGGVEVQGSLWLWWHGCNEWAVCVWSAPASIQYGEPASLRFELPTAYGWSDGAPPTIGTVTAYAGWHFVNSVWPVWHTAVSIDSPPQKYHHHDGGQGDLFGTADEAGPFEAPVGVPLAAPPADPGGPSAHVALAPGALSGQGSGYDLEHLDLVDVDLRAEGGDVVARWTVASLEALPDHDLLYFLDFGIEGKEVWEIGFLKELSGAYGYAGHCISYECAGDFGGDHEAHDMSGHFSGVVESSITMGTPATIEVRAPLPMFPSIRAGDVVDLLTAEALYSDASVWVGRYGDEARADWHKMSTIDYRWGATGYAFTEGNEGPPAGHHGGTH